MWKLLLKRRLRKNSYGNSPVTLSDIENSSTILFSVFARYGDGITSFKVLNEFISYYPEKKYILITSPQLYPYARKIIKNNEVRIHFINKRRNPIKLVRIIYMLKRAGADLGFNPWSHGAESEFFITFARKYAIFKNAAKFPRQYNVYGRARNYLLMKSKDTNLRTPVLENSKIKNVVIAPFSTDVKKNLGHGDIIKLIEQLKIKFSDPRITVAFPDKQHLKETAISEQKFLLGKSMKKSDNFLRLLETSDLFVGVDAGPLHLADALGLKSIGIFGSNAAETFMDSDSNILPVRHKKLDGIFCFVSSCKDPVCIHEIFQGNFFEHAITIDFDRKIRLETEEC